jgi:DNA-binding transcriptional MerR regulator
MDMLSPRYRIHAVSQLTGVSTATLRAWERRYGFPSPSRTSSAYRLYSDYDVDLLKRMKELVESGIAPNEAARELLETSTAAPTAPPLEETEDPYHTAAMRIVDAAGRLDTTALNREVRRALLLDSGLVAFEKILRPALIKIGDLWHKGEVSIASEHFASHVIAAATLDLIRMVTVPSDAPSMIMACFADEQHVLPLYGASLEVASWGIRPVIMGARTPASAIARATQALKPDLVGLSVTVAPTPASAARELVDAYADACRNTPFTVGGYGTKDLASFVIERGGFVMPEDSRDRRKVIENAIADGRKSRSEGSEDVAPKGARAKKSKSVH